MDSEIEKQIAEAVTIFRRLKDAQDGVIFSELVASGMERTLAARLVEFVPIAYCRFLLAGTAMHFPDVFERRLSNGATTRHRFSSQPIWNAVEKFVRADARNGLSKGELLSVAGRSAEFQVINKLINDGSDLKDLRLTPYLFLWPDDGPQQESSGHDPRRPPKSTLRKAFNGMKRFLTLHKSQNH